MLVVLDRALVVGTKWYPAIYPLHPRRQILVYAVNLHTPSFFPPFLPIIDSVTDHKISRPWSVIIPL